MKFNFDKFLKVFEVLYDLVKIIASITADVLDDGKINHSNRKNDEE